MNSVRVSTGLQGQVAAVMQTVVLSQLDSLRRELITISQDGYAAVTYSKVQLLRCSSCNADELSSWCACVTQIQLCSPTVTPLVPAGGRQGGAGICRDAGRLHH
jgi:hypothetical protein